MEDEVLETGTEEMDFSAFLEEEDGATPAEPETEEEEDPAQDGEAAEENEEGEAGAAGDDQQSEGYTIKVNGTQQTVAPENVVPLLQKGSDYDRVRQKLDDARAEADNLRQQIADGAELRDMLEMIASSTGMDMMAVAENLYINLQKQNGVSEEIARANLKAEKLEKQLSDLNKAREASQSGEQAQQERANREVAEFRQNFPNVEITQELAEKLMADVQAGMSLSAAYQKMLSAEKDAEIARLKTELEASKKNKANKSSSAGSMKDSGGKSRRDSFDEFMAMISD